LLLLCYWLSVLWERYLIWLKIEKISWSIGLGIFRINLIIQIWMINMTPVIICLMMIYDVF
jgi:hypothetical protein